MPGERDVELILDTTASPACLDEVHELFERLWAVVPDVATTDRMAFETAVAEVAANIVEHAARGEAVPLHLLLHAGADRVEAHLEDGGYPYDEGAGTPIPAGDLPERGRGLVMARALTDQLVYERDGAVNHWFLSRRRTDRH
jgi:serine/threonine-protein kinase RsbW